MISSKELAKTIFDISRKDEQEANVLSDNLPIFMTEYGLSDMVPSVIRKLETYGEEEKKRNTLFIRVPSGSLLSEEIQKSIKQKLDAVSAKILIVEDQNIIAGFVAEYRDKMFDASASNQADKLQREFKK